MAVKISGLPELTVLNGAELIPLVSGNVTKQMKYSTLKQDILKNVPSGGSSSWSDISDKPFTSIGNGLTVADGVLSADNTGGIDFDALAVAMTTGTQSGITVTADTTNSRFNFEVTYLPVIAIDSDGYWTVDGKRGENPTKAQGEKGKDGASPTIDPTTKNWIVGTVDTGVKAEAQSNYFYTGSEFPTSDLIDGDLFLSFADDTRGNVYQYQELTLDWSLQGNLYGGGAVIDDTSTTGNTVTWSASKINSVLGDINTILASVVGGVS